MDETLGEEPDPLLHSAVGKVRRIEGTVYVVTEQGEDGVVLYGPYQTLAPGNYEVEFYAMPDEISHATCVVVDVLRRGRAIAAEKDFTASELILRNGIMVVRFEVIERDTFEFRMTATGSAALTVRYHRPLRQIADGGASSA